MAGGDRMYLPGRIGTMPTRQQSMPDRQQIPPTPPRDGMMPTGAPMGMPGMGGSQGLFQAYMQNLFRQKYAPPMMQGSPLQNFGGYFGFGSPAMSPIQRPQPNPVTPGFSPQTDPMSPANKPGTTWSEYFNAGGD